MFPGVFSCRPSCPSPHFMRPEFFPSPLKLSRSEDSAPHRHCPWGLHVQQTGRSCPAFQLRCSHVHPFQLVDFCTKFNLKKIWLLYPCDFPGKNAGVGCLFFPRGYFWPRIKPDSSALQAVSCMTSRFFTDWANRKAPEGNDALLIIPLTYQFSSVSRPCSTLWDPINRSTPGLPVHHQLWSLLELMSIQSMMPSNHLILFHSLLLLSSIFPIIRVFSNESVLHIRRPKYWSFSFSISPSSEYSGLISFRMDWFDLLAV